jgi:hypothetical protein
MIGQEMPQIITKKRKNRPKSTIYYSIKERFFMKLTKAKLQQIIQEELQAVLAETLSAEKQAKLDKLKKKKNKSKEDKEKEKSLKHQ